MKKTNSILAITLLILAVVTGGSKEITDDPVMVNVRGSYSKKQIKLQDIFDLEYVALESTDDFICGGAVKDISDRYIAVTNENNDGDIFIFDRNGNGLKKINHRGQGPGEYIHAGCITLDEVNNEMIISSVARSQILVYDFNGNFIRNVKLQDGYNTNGIKNLDKEHWMCISFSMPIGTNPSFFILSKKEGIIVKTIEMPYKNLISNSVRIGDGPFGSIPAVGYPCEVFPYRDNWMLAHSSSDTVFMYSLNHKMTPVIVRTPTIQSMNPETFLVRYMFTDRYWFMESVKKEYDVSTKQFPTKHLMYDNKEKAIFEYEIFNEDYSDKPFILSDGQSINSGCEIALFAKYEAFELLEANKKGKLKGKLKEITSKLKEDDNPVIILLMHKK